MHSPNIKTNSSKYWDNEFKKGECNSPRRNKTGNRGIKRANAIRPNRPDGGKRNDGRKNKLITKQMTYNPNIHHRRSIRLKGYDYSQAGAYFITICCQDRDVSTFGEIVDGKMILNDYGNIAYNEWGNTPNIRKNVELDVFVIMPNHLHGIIIINDIGRGELHSPNIKTDQNRKGELHSPIISGECNSPQPPRQGFRSPSQTVGAIVRGFEGSVMRQINTYESRRGEMLSPDNEKGECNSPQPSQRSIWQRDYYEHIIRTDKSYQRISDYIIENPARWEDDKFYLD